MFLTHKSLKRIKFLCGTWIALAVLNVLCAVVFSLFDVEVKDFIILALVSLLFCFLTRKGMPYTEGKAKLVSKGIKLVRRELRPAEFVRLYEEKKNCPDNAVIKPDVEVLCILLLAYDLLGKSDKVLEVLDEMDSASNEKTKKRVKLIRAGILYDMSMVEEAEAIYGEVASSKLDFATKMSLDAVIRGDRARALGDYVTAEAYFKQNLDASSKNTDPCTLLNCHINLGEIYVAKGEGEKAREHLCWCAENGGETAVKTKAEEMLKNL